MVILEQEKIVLKGDEKNTTHNRMELMSVIKAIEFVDSIMERDVVIQLFTDSQYVAKLPERSGQMEANNFITKKGEELRNADLLKRLIGLFANHTVHLNKVKAHQKKDDTINLNRVVDRLSRNELRALVKEATKI